MDYFLANWGSFVGLLGLIITLVGFPIAIWRAIQARNSAAAAETASKETREVIAQVLNVVELQRAIAVIQRLKVLHRDSKWEASLEHYQTLRAMLADIDARYPSSMAELHVILREAIPQIRVIEDSVDRAIREGALPSGARNFNRVMNTIQASLEEIASSTHFPGSEAGK